MEPLDEARCRKILELPPNPSLEEIHQAYQRLKRIYGDERATFLAPSMDEFSDAVRDTILVELETAHGELCRCFEATHPQVHLVPLPNLDEASLPVDGPGLRKIREASGATLEFLTAETHVRSELLQALEDERFEDLPHAAVNVRGFLTAYVTQLGLPVDAIVAGYMQRYQHWQTTHPR